MALIEERKGRRDDQAPSGYTRVFGIPALGNLMSRVQGVTIANGNELEKLIMERVKKIDDLDTFITDYTENSKTPPGVWVAQKKQIKKSEIIHSSYEPDLLAFDLEQKRCFIIEVKDGDQFDTKKAAGEHTTLHAFNTDISRDLPFTTRIYMCCFNNDSEESIFKGLKGKFNKDEILTGKALCNLLRIDYDEIVKVRTSEQQTNLEYFVGQFLAIPAIRYMVQKALKSFKD